MSGKPTAPDVPGHEVLAYLGRGGMGTVWKARRDDGGLVAVKLLEMRPGADGGDGERFFRRESLACLNLDHPHLVRGREVGRTEAGIPFLTLDYVEGETLWKRVRTSGPLDRPALVRIGVQIADALAYAHARKLVHGDVKPQNVMLDEQGATRLLDLGLVTAPGVEAGQTVYASAAYGAPETLREGKLTPRTDLYSLGATLLAALTGRAPYRGKTQREIAQAALAGPPSVPEQVDGHAVDADLRRVISRLTRSDPAERYGSAEELRLELESLADGDRPLGALIADHVEPGPPARALPLVVFLCACAALVGGVAWWAARDDAEPEPPLTVPVVAQTPAAAPRDPRAVEVDALAASLVESPDDFRAARAWIERLRAAKLTAELADRVEAAATALEERFEARADELLAERRAVAERAALAGDWEAVTVVLSTWPEEFAQTDQARAARAFIGVLERQAEQRLETFLDEVSRQINAWAASSTQDRGAVEELGARLRAAAAAAPPSTLPRPAITLSSDLLSGMLARIERDRADLAAWEAWRTGAEEAFVGPTQQWRDWLAARRGDAAFDETAVARMLETVMASARLADERIRGAVEPVSGRLWAGCQQGHFGVWSMKPGLLEPGLVFGTWMLDPSVDLVIDEAAALRLDPAAVAAWRFVHRAQPVPAELPGGETVAALRALCDGVPFVTPLARMPTADWLTRLRLTLRADDRGLAELDPGGQPTKAWLAAARGGPAPRASAAPARDRAREAFLSGDLHGFMRLRRRALAESPADAELAVMCGRVLWKLSEPLRTTRASVEVLAEARRAWDLEPSLPAGPQLAAEVALYLLESGRLPRETIEPVALLACEETWRQGQASGPALRLVGEKRLSEERARDAAPLLRRAAELLPSDGSVQLLLGKAELELRRRGAARTALRRAQELLGADFPEWASTLLRLLGDE